MCSEIEGEVINKWKKTIAEMKPSSMLITCSVFHLHAEINEQEYYPFGEDITNSILESKDVVATDALEKRNHRRSLDANRQAKEIPN